MNQKTFNNLYWFVLFVIVIAYAIGMCLDVMDIDSAQYASISKEMFYNGSYLQVFDGGRDYLDKPPLIFWLSCLSFKLFGVYDWAFRLPSVLVLILGMYSTYRFSKLYYNEVTSKIAVLIAFCCSASYLMTHDVRTDTMLTGWVMFSVWQFAEFNINLKLKHIIFAAIGVGLAMLTKGPIGLVIPLIAFSADFIYNKKWTSFFRWQYSVAVLIIAIILIPMSIGLYEQFDLHPEKEVYNMKGPSGLRFFYWTQSFGRITGESYWDNNPDPFFLFHSFLWSFSPWIVFFIPAIFYEVKQAIKNRNKTELKEVINVAGFIIIILFLSRSKYQLPHYTFCIHPLAAIITAKYIYKLFFIDTNNQPNKIIYSIHNVFMALFFIIAFALIAFVFAADLYVYLIFIIGFFGYLYFMFSKKTEHIIRFLAITLIPFATLAFILNTHFYPNLLSYQSSAIVGKDLSMMEDKPLVVYNTGYCYSHHFYSNSPSRYIGDKQECANQLIATKSYVLVDSTDFEFIKSIQPTAIILKRYSDFQVTQLSPDFLNPATRQKTILRKFLITY